VAYKPQSVEKPIGEIVSDAGLKQAHIAETEKYPHATYYINGGRETAYPGEEDVLIPSRKDIKTHDEAPEMRAKEICDEAVARVSSVDFMFINFANPDMVGHTANEPAIITAIEVVDHELERLTKAVLAVDGALVVIADHGNAETMVDTQTHQPHTAHTTNPVPCILVHNSLRPKLRQNQPGLKDVAPTVLDLLGLAPSSSMTGQSIIESK
jgi:2,3-bisphosphoglycerate-independent phosphoglycerate mutase